MLLIEEPDQHDTNEIREGVLDDVPIPTRSLGVPGHDVTCDAHTFRTDLSIEILVRQMLLVQEERQVSLLPIHSHAGQHLPSPGEANGTYTVRRVTSLPHVVLQDTSVRKVSRRIQMRKHGALNTFMQNEQVVGGYIQRAAAVDEPLVITMVDIVILVVSHQKAKGGRSSGSGHTRLGDLLQIRVVVLEVSS